MNKRTWIVSLGLVAEMAASGWALTISPSRTEVRLSPGKQIHATLDIMNEESQPVQVEVSEKDWFVLPANKQYKISDWLKVHGSKQFILKPGQKRKVKLTLEAPKDAQGELVGMTSFLYRGEQPSTVTPMISVSVYLSVIGTEKVTGEITDLVVASFPDRLRVLATVKNTGNVHLRPAGQLTLLTSQGAVVKNLTVPEGTAPTYPGSQRPYVGDEMGYHIPPGFYRVEAALMSADLSLKAERNFCVAAGGQIHMLGSQTDVGISSDTAASEALCAATAKPK